MSYTWPMGLIGPGFWSALADGADGDLSCPTDPFGLVGARVSCTEDGWGIGATNGSDSFSASGVGSIPLGVPIFADIGPGSVIIICGGEWGSCCADTGAGTVCWGCEVSPGFPGGFGESQCIDLVGFAYPFGATWNGDHATCTPDPCTLGAC
jgi:hypothetical protein